MARSTASRIAALTCRLPLITCDTVPTETPARRGTAPRRGPPDRPDRGATSQPAVPVRPLVGAPHRAQALRLREVALRSAASSALVGNEASVPFRVTESEAAATAHLSAPAVSNPSVNAAARTPQ